MKAADFIELYKNKQKIYGEEAYRHISELLIEAKAQHRKDFQGKDFEQSWKPIKGRGLEKIIEYILFDGVKKLGFDVVSGNKLEKGSGRTMSKILRRVKENVLIDYGEFGRHMPDVDMVIYDPKNGDVIAIISSKTTLRERIAQTGYWKMKLAAGRSTKHIRVYFLTPDEDQDLQERDRARKSRAIVETAIDGSYVLSETEIVETDKVKMFDKFFDDLEQLIVDNRKR